MPSSLTDCVHIVTQLVTAATAVVMAVLTYLTYLRPPDQSSKRESEDGGNAPDGIAAHIRAVSVQDVEATDEIAADGTRSRMSSGRYPTRTRWASVDPQARAGGRHSQDRSLLCQPWVQVEDGGLLDRLETQLAVFKGPLSRPRLSSWRAKTFVDCSPHGGRVAGQSEQAQGERCNRRLQPERNDPLLPKRTTQPQYTDQPSEQKDAPTLPRLPNFTGRQDQYLAFIYHYAKIPGPTVRVRLS